MVSDRRLDPKSDYRMFSEVGTIFESRDVVMGFAVHGKSRTDRYDRKDQWDCSITDSNDPSSRIIVTRVSVASFWQAGIGLTGCGTERSPLPSEWLNLAEQTPAVAEALLWVGQSLAACKS